MVPAPSQSKKYSDFGCRAVTALLPGAEKSCSWIVMAKYTARRGMCFYLVQVSKYLFLVLQDGTEIRTYLFLSFCSFFLCSHLLYWPLFSLSLLLRGTILNRTYGTHTTLYISLLLPDNSWPCVIRPTVILRGAIVNRTKYYWYK